MKINPLMMAALAMAMLGGCATRGGYGIDQRQGISEAADAEETLAEPANERSTYLALIRRMQRDGMYYASLAHVDAYAARYGSSAELELLRCDGLRGTAQYSAAETGYRKLLLSRSAPAAAWHGLGLLLGRRDDFGGAASLFAEAVRRAPTDVNFLNDYGYASLRAGQRDDARIAITKAAELDPANQKALSNLALYLYSNGDRNGAEAVMERAGLSMPTRASVRELARQFAAAKTPAPAAAGKPERVAHVDAPVTLRTAAAPRNEDFAIKSMLDRFKGG